MNSVSHSHINTKNINLNIASMTHFDFGNCFMCCSKLSLPTQLLGCSCNLYGCLTCVRDYLENFGRKVCPTCEQPVINCGLALSRQYVRCEEAWRIDDARPIDEREFDATCRRCEQQFGSQEDVHHHLLTICPNSRTMCQYCRKQIVRCHLHP